MMPSPVPSVEHGPQHVLATTLLGALFFDSDWSPHLISESALAPVFGRVSGGASGDDEARRQLARVAQPP